MLYFINPKKSTRKAKRGRTRKLFGAAKAAFLRRMAKGRKKKARPARRAKRTRRVASVPRSGVSVMAKRRRARRASGGKRRRRRPVARKAAPRRRRRASTRRRSRAITFRRVGGSVYRRNPGGLSVASIQRTLIQGAKDAAAVVAGEAVVNFVGRKIADKLPGAPSVAKTLAMRAALAIGVGVAARRFVGSDAARFAVAGALASPVKTALRSVIPADSELATALASDEELGLYPDGFGAYPEPEVVGNIGPGGVRALGDSGGWDGVQEGPAVMMAGMY